MLSISSKFSDICAPTVHNANNPKEEESEEGQQVPPHQQR